MRALADTYPDSSPKLVWLVTLLAAAAIVLAPGTAFGADEACAVDAQDCVEPTTAVAGAVDQTVTDSAVAPVDTPPPPADPPPAPEPPPTTGVSTEPPVGEPAPVDPTTIIRVDTTPPVIQEPPVVVNEPAPVEPAPPAAVEPPADAAGVQLAPDAAPVGPPPTPFAADATRPATGAPDVAPTTPSKAPSVAPLPVSRPDSLALSIPDAPPAANKKSSAPVAPVKSKININAFTGDPATDGAFVKGLDDTVNAVANTANAVTNPANAATLLELFSTSDVWTSKLVAAQNSLLETLATYLIPGEGGSYTATLAALIQLAFVLVAWMLIRPRPISSSLSPLRSSQRAGYRAVVFRPG